MKDAGFEAAFTVDYGPVRPGHDMLSLQRVPIFGCLENELEHFRLRIEKVPALCLMYDVRTRLRSIGLNSLADYVPIP